MRNKGFMIALVAGLCLSGTALAGDPCDADLDGSGTVDGIDLGTLLANWSIPAGSPGCGGALPCPSDLDSSGTVDGIDLGNLLAAWSTTGCGATDPVDTNLAGNNLSLYPFFEYVDTFNLGSTVNIALDPTRFPAIAGRTCDVYIVADKTAAQWSADRTLTDLTTGGPTTVAFSAGTIQPNRFTVDAGTLAGPAATSAALSAAYDIVCDCDQNGSLSPADFIDGRASGAGMYIARNGTNPGPLAFTEVIESATVGSTTPGFEARDIYFPSTIASMGQLPLIIVSHGNGHFYQWYDHIGQHMASYGYIVLSHANDTVPGVFTASTTTLQHTNAIIAQQATSSGGALNGHIDTSRILWIGHSRGAEGVAIATDRVFDGAFAPVGWNLNSLKIVSSMAPTDFSGPALTNPHHVNYHLWTAAADADVNGCAAFNQAQTFHIHDRAEQFRQSICLYGVGHGDLHDGGGSSVAAGPCLIGRPTTHQIMRGYFLALFKHYAENEASAKEFLWRQYEGFRSIGAPDPAANPCVTVNLMYRDGPAVSGNFVIDDFQTNPASNLSSSGGAVTMTVSNYVEGLADDNNSDFLWNPADPMNGMTIGGFGDSTRAAVFDWSTPAFIEWAIIPAQSDLTGRTYLQFRACQGTQHPNTAAIVADMTFRVALRDGSGTTSTIDLRAFRGGIEDPYQRSSAQCPGIGWHNDFETIRIRLSDFLNNGSGLDLTDVVAVRLVLGETVPSNQGRLGIDEIELTTNN